MLDLFSGTEYLGKYSGEAFREIVFRRDRVTTRERIYSWHLVMGRHDGSKAGRVREVYIIFMSE